MILGTVHLLVLEAVDRDEVTCGPNGYRLNGQRADDHTQTLLESLLRDELIEFGESPAAVVPVKLTTAGEVALKAGLS